MNMERSREHLIQARRQKGYTQEDVAKLVRISRVAYNRIERGKMNPSIPVAKKIGEVVGMEWPDLYDWPPVEGY